MMDTWATLYIKETSNLRECSAKQNNIAKRNSRVNEVLDTGKIGVVHLNSLFDEAPVYKVRHPEEGAYSKEFSCEWEAAEYRDQVIAKHFFCENNDGVWPTINFILWNTDPMDSEKIVHDTEYYDNYMQYHCEEMLQHSIEWLSQQTWARYFYDDYIRRYDDEFISE